MDEVRDDLVYWLDVLREAVVRGEVAGVRDAARMVSDAVDLFEWMATGCVGDGPPDSAAVEMGRRGGRRGGLARAAALSKERRSEIARNAAAARWGR